MRIIAEGDVRRDLRNRVALPGAVSEYYHITAFDDGHFEPYPRVISDLTISRHTLVSIDHASDNRDRGHVGAPVDPSAVLAALSED